MLFCIGASQLWFKSSKNCELKWFSSLVNWGVRYFVLEMGTWLTQVVILVYKYYEWFNPVKGYFSVCVTHCFLQLIRNLTHCDDLKKQVERCSRSTLRRQQQIVPRFLFTLHTSLLLILEASPKAKPIVKKKRKKWNEMNKVQSKHVLGTRNTRWV